MSAIPSGFYDLQEALVGIGVPKDRVVKEADKLMQTIAFQPEGHVLCACNDAWIPADDEGVHDGHVFDGVCEG